MSHKENALPTSAPITFEGHAKRMIPHLKALLDICEKGINSTHPPAQDVQQLLLDKLDEKFEKFEKLLTQRATVDVPKSNTDNATEATPAFKLRGPKTPIELLSEIIQGIVTESSLKYQASITLYSQEDLAQKIVWKKLFDEENKAKPVQNFLPRDDLQNTFDESHKLLSDSTKRVLVEQLAGVVVPEQLDGDLDHDWITLFRGSGGEDGQQTKAMTRMWSEEAFQEMKAAKERGEEASEKKALRFAVDGRNDTDNWPHFLLKDAGYATQTAKIDIFCMLFLMLCEVKMSRHDAYCIDSLQQMLNRIRVLVSMNCFVRKAFGFCANGDRAFLVVFERRLQGTEDDRREVVFEDAYTTIPINPLWITTIWNALVERALHDLSEFFHPDAMVVAQAIQQTFDANILGYVRVSLEAQSSSRVYCVRPAHVGYFSGQRRCIHAELNDPPLCAVKVQSCGVTRGAAEHEALRRIHSKLTAGETAADSAAEIDAFRRAFYVHASILFGPSSEEPDKVEFARRWDVYHTLKAIEQFFFKSDAGAADSRPLFWWEQLGKKAILKKYFPTGAAAVVMDYGCSLKKFVPHVMKFDNEAWDTEDIQLVDILNAWLKFFHSAGVFHTDLRIDNVMLFQKRSLESLAWCGEHVNGFDEKTKALWGVSASLSERFESAAAAAEETETTTNKPVSQPRNSRNRSGNTSTALAGVEQPHAVAPVVSTTEHKLFTGWFPQPIDFDLAVCAAAENQSSVVVDISVQGARSNLVRKLMYRTPPQQRHVNWTKESELKMPLTLLSQLMNLRTKNK